MKRELLKDKLANKLMADIAAGRYPIGTFLPNELELVKQENVSRSTVRAALEKIENHGLIKRTPHVGTRVIGTGVQKNFDQKLSTISDLDHLANKHPRQILDIRELVVSKELAKSIHCPPGETFIRFSILRLGESNKPPIAWTLEYVNRSWQKLVSEAPKRPEMLMIELISSVYHRRCTEVRQTIEATTLPKEAASHLNAKAGIPCLRILRHYVNKQGHTLLITDTYHPGDRYAFNINVPIAEK